MLGVTSAALEGRFDLSLHCTAFFSVRGCGSRLAYPFALDGGVQVGEQAVAVVGRVDGDDGADRGEGAQRHLGLPVGHQQPAHTQRPSPRRCHCRASVVPQFQQVKVVTSLRSVPAV